MSNACLHRIVIEPTTIRGDQGQYYRVRYEDEVLIEETWNPELEACRALIARGITGRMEVWRAGKAHADIIVPSIEEAARWSVVENDKERALSLSYGSRCPRTFSEMPFPAVGGFRQRLILCLGYPVTHPPRPRPKNSPHRQISRRQPLPREIAMPKGIPTPITHLSKREQPLCGGRTRRGSHCQRRALDNGRCRNHGGLSTGPKTAEGRQRISEAQRKRWADWRVSCH